MTGLSYDNLGASKAIVIAIDRSQSMTGAPLEQAAAAARDARAAEAKLRPGRGRHLRLDGPRPDVVLAVRDRRGHGARPRSTPDGTPGTALYDAVVLSASDLKAQALPGRVLVLLTDGHDVRSLASLDRGAARREARERRRLHDRARQRRRRSAQAARRRDRRILLLQPYRCRALGGVPAGRLRARPHLEALLHDNRSTGRPNLDLRRQHARVGHDDSCFQGGSRLSPGR